MLHNPYGNAFENEANREARKAQLIRADGYDIAASVCDRFKYEKGDTLAIRLRSLATEVRNGPQHEGDYPRAAFEPVIDELEDVILRSPVIVPNNTPNMRLVEFIFYAGEDEANSRKVREYRIAAWQVTPSDGDDLPVAVPVPAAGAFASINCANVVTAVLDKSSGLYFFAHEECDSETAAWKAAELVYRGRP